MESSTPEELADRMEHWRKNLELSFEAVIEANIALDLRSTGHLEGDSKRIAQWLMGSYNPAHFTQEISGSDYEQFTRRLDCRNKFVNTTTLNTSGAPEVNRIADPSTHSLFQQLASNKAVDNNLLSSIRTHVLQMNQRAGSPPDVRHEALTSPRSTLSPAGGPGDVQVHLRCSTAWGRGDSPISFQSEESENASRSGNADRTWISDSCAATAPSPSSSASIHEIDVGVSTAWGRGDSPSFPLFEKSDTSRRLAYTDCLRAPNGCAEYSQAQDDGVNAAWGKGDFPSFPLSEASDMARLWNISASDGCITHSKTPEDEEQTSLPRSNEEEIDSLGTAQPVDRTLITSQFRDVSTQAEGERHCECECNQTRKLEEEKVRRLSEEVRRLHDELRQLRAQMSSLHNSAAPNKKRAAGAAKHSAKQPRSDLGTKDNKKSSRSLQKSSSTGKKEAYAAAMQRPPKLSKRDKGRKPSSGLGSNQGTGSNPWTTVASRRPKQRYIQQGLDSRVYRSSRSRNALGAYNSPPPSPTRKLCWTCRSPTHLHWACPERKEGPKTKTRRRRDDLPSQPWRNDGSCRPEPQRQKCQQSPVHQSSWDWSRPPLEFSGITVMSDPPCACGRSLDVDRLISRLVHELIRAYPELSSLPPTTT